MTEIEAKIEELNLLKKRFVDRAWRLWKIADACKSEEARLIYTKHADSNFSKAKMVKAEIRCLESRIYGIHSEACDRVRDRTPDSRKFYEAESNDPIYTQYHN